MAHKVCIDGTAYEIDGGKAMVDGAVYEIDHGTTLVDGTAYEVGFGSWPDDLDTGLEFISSSAFTLSVAYPGWDGTMEYCNSKDGWQTWDGSEISSGKAKSGQCIYIRGTGNTKVTGAINANYAWTLTGTAIKCNGNIEKLLDYATAGAGGHPTMAARCYQYMFHRCTALTTVPSLPATTLTNYCYASMFTSCTALTTAPSLPATTLGGYCYANMFQSCTALTTVPSLPATTLTNYCYQHMFNGCTKIKLSSSNTGTYTKAYRIPYSGTGTTATNSLAYMFNNTGGAFTGTPSINTTYYLDSSNTIV